MMWTLLEPPRARSIIIHNVGYPTKTVDSNAILGFLMYILLSCLGREVPIRTLNL
jgi:hypothetical protein